MLNQNQMQNVSGGVLEEYNNSFVVYKDEATHGGFQGKFTYTNTADSRNQAFLAAVELNKSLNGEIHSIFNLRTDL